MEALSWDNRSPETKQTVRTEMSGMFYLKRLVIHDSKTKIKSKVLD